MITILVRRQNYVHRTILILSILCLDFYWDIFHSIRSDGDGIVILSDGLLTLPCVHCTTLDATYQQLSIRLHA